MRAVCIGLLVSGAIPDSVVTPSADPDLKQLNEEDSDAGGPGSDSEGSDSEEENAPEPFPFANEAAKASMEAMRASVEEGRKRRLVHLGTLVLERCAA